MLKKTLTLSNLTLIVALSLSTVAAYYSIIGLTAIFAGAVIPIIIMGGILEVGKITATVWLRKYWNRCGFLLKCYLVPAVVLLAILTSMGIFGFLSKAHTDTGLVSGDAQAKLALFDEKIKTERENIELARKALQQMDAQVDARLSRGDSEASAERAVQIRRQQQGERQKLLKDINEAQKRIATLNEERAPIAAETRKIEAEVGPIKYVAALIYGDNPDSNLLERAVRWVIILLVIVFDPLAIALVLAANASKEWDKEKPDEKTNYEKDDSPITDSQVEQLKETAPKVDVWPFPDPVIIERIAPSEPMKFDDPGEHPKDKFEDTVEDKPVVEDHPYLKNEFVHFKDTKPLVADIEKPKKKKVRAPKKKVISEYERPGDYLTDNNSYIVKADQTPYPWKKIDETYVSYEGRVMRKEALQQLKPELFMLTADHNRDIKTSFGSTFPTDATKGDMYVRIDMMPNKVFKFDGTSWIEVNKQKTDTYLFNEKYLAYLIEKIETGQYDIELLSENEKSQIEDYLHKEKNSDK